MPMSDEQAPPSAPNQDRSADFGCLIGAQFLGAFNDNLYKQLLLFLAGLFLFPSQDKQGLAFAIFAVPFILFSGLAGDISERYSKQSVMWRMKVTEVLVMLLGALAFWSMNWHFMLFVLFLMGVQSAIFGPCKYGVIPELIGPRRLVRANGTMAMTTFMGILLGQALAGPLLDALERDEIWVVGAVCVAIAVIGTTFAMKMGPLPPTQPDLEVRLQPFAGIVSTIRRLRQVDGLLPVVLLYSFFWFNGGILQQAITGLGERGYLDIGPDEVTQLSLLLAILAVSIILGSLAVPVLARRMAIGRVALIGAVMMSAFQFLILLIGPVVSREDGGLWLARGLMVGIGFFGACFVVPIQSFLQSGPPPGMRGQTFAVNNFLNFIFLFLAGLWYLLFRGGVVSELRISAAETQALGCCVLLIYLAWRWRCLLKIKIGGDSAAPNLSEDG